MNPDIGSAVDRNYARTKILMPFGEYFQNFVDFTRIISPASQNLVTDSIGRTVGKLMEVEPIDDNRTMIRSSQDEGNRMSHSAALTRRSGINRPKDSSQSAS